MPAELNGIVMKAEPGAEFACRARNHQFEYGGRRVEHGVISYYASRTLPQATSVGAWLQQIDRMASDDLAAGRLPAFLQLSLRILGDPATPLPGAAGARR